MEKLTGINEKMTQAKNIIRREAGNEPGDRVESDKTGKDRT